MDAGHTIRTYREFWPYYLTEHAKSRTRVLHFAGTGLATVFLIIGAVSANIWFILAALVSGYGPAWLAHMLVEKNRPATFRYPLWSLISDFRMTGTWLAGGLSKELERAGVERH